jgi:hypothetical protein
LYIFFDIAENSQELSSVLIIIKDDFEIDNFDQLICNSFIALILRNPDAAIYICRQMFTECIVIASQLRILRVMIGVPLLYVDSNSEMNMIPLQDGKSVSFFANIFLSGILSELYWGYILIDQALRYI